MFFHHYYTWLLQLSLCEQFWRMLTAISMSVLLASSMIWRESQIRARLTESSDIYLKKGSIRTRIYTQVNNWYDKCYEKIQLNALLKHKNISFFNWETFSTWPNDLITFRYLHVQPNWWVPFSLLKHAAAPSIGSYILSLILPEEAEIKIKWQLKKYMFLDTPISNARACNAKPQTMTFYLFSGITMQPPEVGETGHQ
jgi:hypothetical protein